MATKGIKFQDYLLKFKDPVWYSEIKDVEGKDNCEKLNYCLQNGFIRECEAYLYVVKNIKQTD
jgi:hypothetical protein